MSLTNTDSTLPFVLATSLNNPYDEIVIPCLKEASFFKMGVGFFESDWVDLAKDGLLRFVENGGKMELLTSVQVGEDEFLAFQTGEKAKTDAILKQLLVDKALNDAASRGKEWTLHYLAWMIAEGILEVRLLIHKTSRVHMYHDKLSFWYDDFGNSVCFQGSLNSTRNAIENEEAMALYASWRPGGTQYIHGFEGIWKHDWDGQPKNFICLDLPEIVKASFKKIADPHNPHLGVVVPSSNNKQNGPVGTTEDREYQQTAIGLLKENGYKGVLAMATGTGKTFTSLLAAKQLMKEHGNCMVLITVPQTTLIKQWIKSIDAIFGHQQVITCAFDKASWFSKLAGALRLFDEESPLFAITTYDSLVALDFQKMIASSKCKHIYVFDECHKLGTSTIMRVFKPKENSFRIGLSATPDRWFDKTGTDFIRQTIGPTVYEYSMKEAIDNGKLCQYNYYPILVPLTDDETTSFISLSSRIVKNAASNEGELSEAAKMLLEKRARISKTAANKWECFFEVFAAYKSKTGSIVYVFDEQVDEMVRQIKQRFNLNVHGIVASTNAEDREKILTGFNNHEIDVLVAIQCLDEGVDVPNCHAEFILASSTNPREFIQRRGRVLRLSKEKPDKVADIFDFVSTASESMFVTDEQKVAVIKRELPRVAEFVRLSKNKADMELMEYLIRIKGIQEYAKAEPWAITIDVENEEDAADAK